MNSTRNGGRIETYTGASANFLLDELAHDDGRHASREVHMVVDLGDVIEIRSTVLHAELLACSVQQLAHTHKHVQGRT